MQKSLPLHLQTLNPITYSLTDCEGCGSLVIWYHVFEGFATSPIDQKFNHGYLAVDYFFILSGFVIGYAYDDRWKTTMTQKSFSNAG